MSATPASPPTTTVVSVKTCYIRPEYDTLQKWMEDTDKNVYVARRGVVFVPAPPQEKGAFLTRKPNAKVRFPPTDSPFANPFKLSLDAKKMYAPTSKEYAAQVMVVIKKYDVYIRAKIANGEITKEQIQQLKGKRLGCWCKMPDKKGGNDVPCHGDILKKIVDEMFP